ncbi:uncharacterized protein LOC133322927 [Musca vetustissima]|uniref:uncharacterized protein LOC133322927 n=1 Tax=Musca vetustissima TaxID=27455 RepID=UPI002AB6037D|nr:uncharacterized protein LOC133322927 [Musca vetustissima]
MADDNKNNNNVLDPIVPLWIKAELFEDVLREIDPNFLSIEKFEVNGALSPGENYASIMLKVDIVMKLQDGSNKSQSFMLKVLHDNELFRELIQTYNMFDVESGIYGDVVPELEQILADAGINVRFGPKSYRLATDETHILLENLKDLGFRNANRLEGLDMAHSKSVLNKLALWHAASAVRVQQKGLYPDIYSAGYFRHECYDMMKEMFDSSTKMLLECIREYSNSDLYYEKVVKLQHQVTDELYKVTQNFTNDGDGEEEDEFRVLNHGDVWSNNIMFKYDEKSGELLETYLVDYQLPSYSSPAQDILYFILTSCKYEIKLQEFDYMIAYYHKLLAENLRLLKYPKKIPSLRDIHCMIFKYGIWGYVSITNVMAPVLCEPSDNANLDNFISETDDGLAFKRQMYSNARYRKHMEAILPWLLNRGLLDC